MIGRGRSACWAAVHGMGAWLAVAVLLIGTTVWAQSEPVKDGPGAPAAEASGQGPAADATDGSGETPTARPGGAIAADLDREAPLPLPPVWFEDGLDGDVVVVRFDGEVSPGRSVVLRRAMQEAEGAGLFVVRMNTFGGRVDSAVQIRDALMRVEAPVLVYVEDRAISAGALITYAADHIVFSPSATMGAATPYRPAEGGAEEVDAKVVSYMRAEMRATAEASGRRVDVAEAMVDRAVVIDGFVDDATLLTVTTREALALGIADGSAPDLDALLEAIGAGGATVVEVENSWADQVAIALTSPVVAGLLMSLGLLGLWVEIKTPGFGAGGAIAIFCFGAFFFGHGVAWLAGWEEIILLGVGLFLMVLEIFVIPGFGIAGIAGLICIISALLMAMVGLPLGASFEVGSLNDAAWRIVASLTLAIVAAIALAKVLPSRAMPGWLVLRDTIDEKSGVAAGDDADNGPRMPPVFAEGVAMTDLRPSGRARFGGEPVDVVSRDEYIQRGQRVRIVEVAGVRVLVERIAELSESAGPVASPAAADTTEGGA